MRSVLSAVLAAFLVLTLAACPRRAGGQVPTDGLDERPRVEVRQDDQADAALTSAAEVERKGDPAGAIEAYLAVRKTYPDTTAGQEALYRAGVLAFDSGDYAAARAAFNELLFENPLFDKAQDARLKLGLSALETQSYRDAYQSLSAFASRATGEERRRALEAAGRAAEGAHLFAEALQIALEIAGEARTQEEEQASLQRVTDLVEGKVPFLEVAKAKESLSASHPAWPILTFKLARIYFHLRDWQRLEETLQSFLRVAPAHAYAEEAKQLLARAARRSEARPNVVGVVLPLSGKYKQLGEAVMRGVKLALKGSDVELVVKDSQGDVNLAGKQVEELAFDEGAIAIIGPLLGDEARRAALVAEELQVPILTLTMSEQITAIGPHVFRNMLTNAQQAQALADYAVNTLGFKSFALLYPNIPFGVEVTNEFWDQVVTRGGAIRAAESYDHDQTTFTSEAKKLVGRYYLEDRHDYLEMVREVSATASDPYRRRKALERVKSKLKPIVDFEAILIPDQWERVGLVAPALAVEDIITNACDPKDLEKIRKTTGRKDLRTVTLLGTSTWSSPIGRSGLPELIERAGKFVMCSVYVDGFFAASSRRATQRFVSAFKDAYKDQQPVLLDAIGYDAALMFRQVIEQSAPRTREEFTTRLWELKDFEGATGKTHFNERREAIKPLFFLTVDREGVKEIFPEGGKKSGS